jgi:hypothetical protein
VAPEDLALSEAMEDTPPALLAWLEGEDAYPGAHPSRIRTRRVPPSSSPRRLAAASQVAISTGGAKGVFMAFCAGLMCRRRHDELRHVGGLMLAPTLSVIAPSKTFALSTARIAFAATSSALHTAVAHYRTVLSQGRVPQIDELTAAGAVCWTPQSWIDGWNGRYRAALTGMQKALQSINAAAGFDAFTIEARLREATTALLGPAGPEIVQAALRRARQVADVDEILATRQY